MMETKIMIQPNQSPAKGKYLTARRLTLLGSVAALGIAVLAAGPGGQFSMPLLHAQAQAAETASQLVGFADLVAKVRPAVISVRVKINETATGMGENAAPFQPGSRLEKFFRQFGLPGAPNGQRPQMVTGEGSG